LAAQKRKGKKSERYRNHGKTIGARDPATEARSRKIGLIAGRIRSGRGCGFKPPPRFWREITGESRYSNKTAQQ